MEELFEDEDFVEEFVKEKEALEEENKPKVSSSYICRLFIFLFHANSSAYDIYY